MQPITIALLPPQCPLSVGEKLQPPGLVGGGPPLKKHRLLAP
jgi:hypothetical protein